MAKVLEQFDEAKYLTDEETIKAYLELSLESGDKAEFIEALNTLARARGITQLAKETGLGRESLYKTLSGSVEPKLSTLERITEALGFKLSLSLSPKTTTNI
ncbi:addiction module antidote protein [Rodentibacter haemolyticus]|uniref:Addiction module antidote protein n=1 Tax=Rodentibacter haemolyticus TaxID=2778911 RepID=A0ABX6UZI4_9PAST|nr:addiction module antidote protein [Rodentibacter haemolyticus]QPB42656.1 putative addiction module antidote protein [Rodentibacter haemolyticus]